MRFNYIIPLICLVVADLSGVEGHHLHAQDSVIARLPPGMYVLTLKQGDPAPPQAMGEWEFHVDSAGYRWIRMGEVLVRGELQVRADTVVVIDRDGDPELVCSEPGQYLWAATSDGLQFSAIEDTCGPRPILLGTHPLRRR